MPTPDACAGDLEARTRPLSIPPEHRGISGTFPEVSGSRLDARPGSVPRVSRGRLLPGATGISGAWSSPERGGPGSGPPWSTGGGTPAVPEMRWRRLGLRAHPGPGERETRPAQIRAAGRRSPRGFAVRAVRERRLGAPGGASNAVVTAWVGAARRGRGGTRPGVGRPGEEKDPSGGLTHDLNLL